MTKSLYQIMKDNNCSSVMAFLLLLEGDKYDEPIQSTKSKSLYDAAKNNKWNNLDSRC